MDEGKKGKKERRRERERRKEKKKKRNIKVLRVKFVSNNSVIKVAEWSPIEFDMILFKWKF